MADSIFIMLSYLNDRLDINAFFLQCFRKYYSVDFLFPILLLKGIWTYTLFH